MNAKTKTQIEEMKQQTIGVEVEMNSICINAPPIYQFSPAATI